MCPMEMGQKLYKIADEASRTAGGDRVSFTQVQAGHNDLMRVAFSDYALAMGFPKPKPIPKSPKPANGVQHQQVQQQQPQQPQQPQLPVLDERGVGEIVVEMAAQDERARRAANVENRHDSLEALRGGVPGVSVIVGNGSVSV
jgi:hypothetical protein